MHSKLNAKTLKKEDLDDAVTGPKRDIKNPKSVQTDAAKLNVQKNSKRQVAS